LTGVTSLGPPDAAETAETLTDGKDLLAELALVLRGPRRVTFQSASR
jgi:hypothetical protein